MVFSITDCNLWKSLGPAGAFCLKFWIGVPGSSWGFLKHYRVYPGPGFLKALGPLPGPPRPRFRPAAGPIQLARSMGFRWAFISQRPVLFGRTSAPSPAACSGASAWKTHHRCAGIATSRLRPGASAHAGVSGIAMNCARHETGDATKMSALGELVWFSSTRV